MTNYRQEIDGLRAIAVLAVIFFHAQWPWFSGGFVGVDVFFVISGYLITTILLREFYQQRFSLVAFYERRARRLFPALFVVVMACLPFGYFWILSAGDLKDFFQSIVSVSTFSANIFFWLEDGYWGGDNALKPLLHMWSLAVEEQYYLLFPLLLIIGWRLSKAYLFLGFAVLTIVSFIISIWLGQQAPVAGYFLIISRFWELAAGGVLAWIGYTRPQWLSYCQHQPRFNQALSLLGFGLIIASVIFINSTMAFPGPHAVWPVLGTLVVLMFALPGTWVHRLLCWPGLVGLGLISYSAYLWHQPVLAFAHIRLGTVSFELTVGLIFVTLVLAYLSWRFVEQPFRNRQWVSQRLVWISTIAGSGLLLVIGLVGHFYHGFPQRPYSRIAQLQIHNPHGMEHHYGLNNHCNQQGSIDLYRPSCRTSDNPKVVLWGDSFAIHLVPALQAQPNSDFIQFTKTSCFPLFNHAIYNRKVTLENQRRWQQQCLSFNQQVESYLAQQTSKKVVAIASPFSFMGWFDEADPRFWVMDDQQNHQPLTLHHFNQLFAAMLTRIKALGHQPVIIGPPPANGTDLGACSLRIWFNREPLSQCDFPLDELTSQRGKTYHWLEQWSQQTPVIFLHPWFCGEKETCRTHHQGTLLFIDSGHLSRDGAIQLGKTMGLYEQIIDRAESMKN